MAIDSQQKRMSVVGVGRPWARSAYPGTVGVSWRLSRGNMYSLGSSAEVNADGVGGRIEPEFQQHLVRLLKYPLPIIPPPESLLDAQTLAGYLQELTRSIEENLRSLFAELPTGGGGPTDLYLASVVSESGGLCTCFLQKYNLVSETLETIPGLATVRDLVDTAHGEDTLLFGDKILCWLVSAEDDSTPNYAGIQHFGRSTIGLP